MYLLPELLIIPDWLQAYLPMLKQPNHFMRKYQPKLDYWKYFLNKALVKDLLTQEEQTLLKLPPSTQARLSKRFKEAAPYNNDMFTILDYNLFKFLFKSPPPNYYLRLESELEDIPSYSPETTAPPEDFILLNNVLLYPQGNNKYLTRLFSVDYQILTPTLHHPNSSYFTIGECQGSSLETDEEYYTWFSTRPVLGQHKWARFSQTIPVFSL